jgi:Uma2 family endonuclease
MGYAKLKTKISVEDYLSGEELSPVRHEYLYGEVWAMAGATQNHGRIVMNLAIAITNKLSGSKCEAYAEGIRVRASEDVFYYPDILVTCEGNFTNRYYSEAPVLIIEVLSDSTEKVDRREKLLAYRMMPSVQEIVLIDQRRLAIEIYKRQPNGGWLAISYDETDNEVTLDSLDFSVAINDIYRRVNFGESSD